MRYVKTDYDGCPYITSGKVYPIHIELYDYTFLIDDDGCLITCMNLEKPNDPASHLHWIGTWTECNTEGDEIGGGDE